MCYCPESLPPPTQELERCRLILQFLALGSFLVALFGILAGEFLFLFHAMMLSYLLYISWARFEYKLALYFFFIAIIFALMTYVILIGTIQYYDRISSQDAPQILFLVARIAYFPNAVFFSHYSYKQFKHYALFSLSSGNSYEMQPVSVLSRPYQPYQNYVSQAPVTNQGNSRGFVAFQGAGTVIG